MSNFSQSPPPIPSAELTVDKDSCNWAMLCHILSLFGYFLAPVIGNIFVPLIVWSIYKDQHPFIDEHGKESLNFQISMTIWLGLALLSMFACVGFVLFPVIYILAIVWIVQASLAASRGEEYRYPLTIRLLQ